MHAQNPWNFTYRTNECQSGDFLAQVQDLVGVDFRSRPARVLEVGCGDGGKTLRLAECWPQAHLTGVDISEPSIALAEQRRRSSPARERLNFQCGDYLTLALDRFDLILADSVLQWIPGPDDRLFGKLAGELAPGGLLLFSIPYACFYNTMLTGVRRVCRLFRSRLLDWLLLSLMGRLHGLTHSREFLRERLNYAYLLARRMGSPALEKVLLEKLHLEVQAVVPYAHASLGQFRHRLWCFRAPLALPARCPQRRSA
jgi:SAM-dependent methyltransferase